MKKRRLVKASLIHSFFVRNGADCLSKYVGEAEKALTRALGVPRQYIEKSESKFRIEISDLTTRSIDRARVALQDTHIDR